MCSAMRIPIFVLGSLFASNKAKYLSNKHIMTIVFLLGVIMLIPWYLHNDLGGNTYAANYYIFLILSPPSLHV